MKPSIALSAKRRSFEDSAILLISATGMLLLLGQWLIPPSYSSPPSVYGIIVQNLRVIDNQKHAWADEHQKGDNDTPSEGDLAPYFQNGKFPPAVIGETYHINPVGQQSTATTPSRLKIAKMTIEAGSVITIPDR